MMATALQHKALEKVVEYGRAGKRINKGKILREVGYAGTTAIAPTKVFESKGFLELCDEIGLTDDFLTKALYEDIRGKPKKREKELRLAFTVRGRLKENEAPNQTFNQFNFYDKEQAKRIAARVIANDSAIESTLDRLSDSNEPEVRT